MKYLDDVLLYRPCHLALFVDEASYLKEMKRLKIRDPNPFLNEEASATTHFFYNTGGDKLDVTVVCVDPKKLEGEDPIVVAGLLVHEAVHVFQDICKHWGETDPSREFEAYSIQRLSQLLMSAYVAALPT